MGLQEINLASFPVFIPQLLSLAVHGYEIKCGQRPGNEPIANGFVNGLKSRKCRKLQNEAKGLHVYYRCSHLHM